MGMARYKSEYAAELIGYFNGRSDDFSDDCSCGTDAAADGGAAVKGGKGEKGVRGEKSGKGGRTGSCAPLPSFAEFAHRKDVLISDIERWREEHAEFARAYAEALEYQRQLILQGVIDGRISPAAAKFYLDERDAPRSGEIGSAQGFKITVSFEGEDDGNSQIQ